MKRKPTRIRITFDVSDAFLTAAIKASDPYVVRSAIEMVADEIVKLAPKGALKIVRPVLMDDR